MASTLTLAGNADFNGSIDVDGHTELDNLGVSGISTFSNDVNFTTANSNNLLLDNSDNSLKFGDNVKATFGASQDLEIHHNGSSTGTIENNAGQLIIRNDESNSAVNKLWLQSNVITLSKPGGSEYYLRATIDGSVDLYYDNVS